MRLEQIKELGGLEFIIISHPHFYTYSPPFPPFDLEDMLKMFLQNVGRLVYHLSMSRVHD